MEGQPTLQDAKNGIAAMSPPLLPSPPGRNNNNMYVVQFPKDQVYRVPPRENAEFMKRYRDPPNIKNRRNCCCHCPRALLTLALVLVAVVAVLALILASLIFIFNPTGPTFTITHVAVRNTSNNNGSPKYEISMRARNTNERLGMVYEESEVGLVVDDNGAKVAEGRFPRLEQDRDGSTQVKVLLKGVKSVGGGKVNARVGFDLEMGLHVRVKLGGYETWVMTANVACVFDVRGVGNNGTRILSQQCDTKFRQY